MGLTKLSRTSFYYSACYFPFVDLSSQAESPPGLKKASVMPGFKCGEQPEAEKKPSFLAFKNKKNISR